jgi:DNA-binding transcriptional regulator YiaG
VKPNLGSVLKSEILRLARKVSKEQLASVQSSSAAQRKQIAALRRQVSDLERSLKRLARDGGRAPKAAAEASNDATPMRFQVRGLKSLRERLDLSAGELAQLIGVSAQTVYNWEAGKTKPRPAQLQALVPLRGIGKREARARLEQLAPAA